MLSIVLSINTHAGCYTYTYTSNYRLQCYQHTRTRLVRGVYNDAAKNIADSFKLMLSTVSSSTAKKGASTLCRATGRAVVAKKLWIMVGGWGWGWGKLSRGSRGLPARPRRCCEEAAVFGIRPPRRRSKRQTTGMRAEWVETGWLTGSSAIGEEGRRGVAHVMGRDMT